MNYYFKVVKNGEIVSKCRTHSKSCFLNNLRTIKWQDGVKIYLRLNYGFAIDNFGKRVPFLNEGIYETKTDLKLAFKAFTEKDLF